MALLTTAGLVIAAGAPIGAAAADNSGGPVAPSLPGIFNPALDIPTSLSSLNNAAQFGLFDPNLLLNSGPLSNAINQLGARGYAGGSGNLSGQTRNTRSTLELRTAFDEVEVFRREGFTLPAPPGPQNLLGPKEIKRAEEKNIEIEERNARRAERGKKPLPLKPVYIEQRGSDVENPDQVFGKKVRKLMLELGLEPGQTLSAAEVASLSADEILMLSSGDRRAVKRTRNVLAQSGFGGLDELFASERQFQESIAPVLAQAQTRADRSLQQQELSQQGLFDFLQNDRLDLAQLRKDEEARNQIQTDQFRQDVLQQANFGGFNPAAGLERSAELVGTSQNETLARALGLLQGNASQAALLASVDPSMSAGQFAPTLQASRNPVNTGISQQSPGFAPGSGMAAAIGNAGNQIGGGLVGFGAQRQSDAQASLDRQAFTRTGAFAP